MPALPAWCPNCNKAVVPPTAAVVESGGTIDFGDAGGLATCPDCGGVATIAPGRYTEREGMVDIFSGSRWTQEKLEKLHEAMRRAQQMAATDPEQAVAEIAKVDPKVAGDLNRWVQDNPGLVYVLGILMQVLIVLLSHYLEQDGALSEAEVRQVAEEVVNERLADKPLPDEDGRTPPAP